MNELINVILTGFGIIVLLLFVCWCVKMLHKVMFGKEKPEEKEEPKEKIEEATLPYIAAKLLTPKEYAFFKALQPIANKYNLLICPKIRLADLLEIQKDVKDKMKWFNYIKAKHIDFTICDLNLNVKFLIEIDDRTHDKPDRQKRDEFVDSIFKKINIHVLHIRQWGTELEGIIVQELRTDNPTVEQSQG